MKTRFLALALAMLLLLLVATGCRDRGSDVSVTTGTQTSGTPTVEKIPEFPIPDGASRYSGKADVSWYTGDKTEYTLTSADQLIGLMVIRENSLGSTTFEGVTIKLGCDMIFNDGDLQEVTERGASNRPWHTIHSKYLFKGTLDGQGHMISGVYIGMTNSGISGMFGSLSGNATIKNLTVCNSLLTAAPVADKQMLGGLAGRILGDDANVTFSDVTVHFNFVERGYAVNRVGGFVGDVGVNVNLTMENCSYYGNIAITGDYAGGLVGYASQKDMSLTLRNCTSGGSISAARYAGGLFGNCTAGSLSMEKCSNSASVNADHYAGGLIGSCAVGTLTSSELSNTGRVTAKALVGEENGFLTVINDPTGGARPATPEGNTAIRVMSFNLRLNLPTTSGVLNEVSQHRFAAARAEILQYDPDFVGVQEDVEAWNANLRLENYNIILGTYLSSSTERTAIYYKKGLKLLEGGNVWLTDSGKESGAALTVADLFAEGGAYRMTDAHLAMLGISKTSSDDVLKNKTYTYVDADGKTQSYEKGYVMLDTRNATYGVFDINGQTVIYLNTHLQHRGQDSEYSNDALQRLRSLERVKEFSYMQKKIEELKKTYPDALVFMTGDWNDHPMTEIYNNVVDGAGFLCANFNSLERYGVHASWNNAFDGTSLGHNYPSKYEGTGTTYLDYIFIEKGITPLKFFSAKGKATVKDENGKDLTIYTSDHLPIVADLCFKTEKTGSPIDPNYQDPSLDVNAPSYYTGVADTSWYVAGQKEFTLTTADQLMGLMKLRIDSKGSITFDGVTVKLARDMVFNRGDVSEGAQYSWLTINSNYLFKGTLDGQGHTVSGIYMKLTDSGVKGMLGGVGGNAVIKDLVLENTYFGGPTVNKNILGTLIAKVAGSGADVTVSGVTVNSTLCEDSATLYYIGGLVGQVEGGCKLTLENCEYKGTINFATKGTKIGGLVGAVHNNATLLVKNSKFSGVINGADECGGLVGYVTAAGSVSIVDSVNAGTVNCVGAVKGELIGSDKRS